MSALGSHKAQITKAANALRNKIKEVDEATLEPLDLTTEAGRDPQFILSHKSSLFLKLTFLDRAVAHLRAQREKADEFARQHPDEHGEYPFLQQIQDHWDAGELDRLLGEAETLHDRLDVAIKLLPSSEVLYFMRASTVSSLLSATQTPSLSHQPAQNVGVEIASHSPFQDQGRPTQPEAVALPDTPPTRASCAAQGFGTPLSHPPINPPTFANPFVTSSNPQPNPFIVPPSNPLSSQLSVEQSLKLPTFEIPTFHGDIEKFFEFWDLFSTTIHNNTSVPVPVKFMYLKSHLRGPAANIIAGFQSTAENYDDAIRSLTNTYGRPEILRNRLWDKLTQLPAASESPLSQRATLAAIRAVWTQLQHLKEDSSAIGTLKTIRAKFPRRTRERIGEYKKKGDPMWTVDELLIVLDTIIDRLESIEDADPSEYHSYNSQSAVRQHSPSPRRYPSTDRRSEAFTRYRTPSRPRYRSASRSLSPSNRQNRALTPHYSRHASYSPGRSRPRTPDARCAFCNDFGHLPDRCRAYPDVRKRRMIVKYQHLCWLCLQPDHSYVDCDAPYCLCGRTHHRALCYELSTGPRSPTPPPRSTHYQDSRRARSPRRVQFYDGAGESTSRRRTYSPRASLSRDYQSRSPSQSRRWGSNTPSRRTSSSRRSPTPLSVVHSTNSTFGTPSTTMNVRVDSPDSSSRDCTEAHSSSSCTSVCCDQSIPREPRLMVVHAVTKNYKTNADELLTVFMDSGSQYSFICTMVAKYLGLTFRNTRSVTTLTFGGHQLTEESSEVTLTLWDQYNRPLQLELWTREKITTVPRIDNVKDSTTADFGDRVEVDVLIGIDNYWRIVDLHRNEKLPSGLVLSHTRFGPVLSGLQRSVVSNSLSATTTSEKDEPESEQLMRTFLGLDTLELDEGEDTENDGVIRQFYDTVAIVDGSIHVSFPWKSDHPPLADNKPLAFRRLQSQYEKFRAAPSAWEDYCRIFDEQLRSGIIEDVTDAPLQGSNIYYIPHQAVYKEDSSTTKLRIVFDASSHQKGCPSLNDCLHQGPSLLPDLVGTLMRSRFHRYLIIADVEKAFHQIHLHQDQRDCTRFLWLKDVHHEPSADNLRILRFARVPFGINASPFLLSMSIRYFLEQDPANRLKEEILANTYVDNLIVGAGSSEECLNKCKQCKDIFARMCMNLREFMTNDSSTMLSIPEHDRMDIQGHFVKLLGIKWNPTLDVLYVPITIAHHSVKSKRTALQAYASTFDPLGFLTPLLVRPKMFIQDLWEAGYGWDDPLAEEYIHKWNTIVHEISGFNSQVPRCLGSTHGDVYDLIFCSDASKRAYATAVYILTRHPDGKSQPTLLFAKAKLAPPGAITIPRMELLACHMAAKTVKFLRKQCKASFQTIRFFTDSQIVLYWIQSRKPLKTYVANRVRYIRRVLDELRADNITTGFYYLTTENNPADCATRGLSALELQNHMWWTGPSFFTTPFEQWPWNTLEPPVASPAGAEAEELPPKAVTTSANKILEPYVSFVPFRRTNSYTKLVRITAYVLKLLAKLRARVMKRHHSQSQNEQSVLGVMDTTFTVTPDDFRTAELLLIREHYREGQHLNSSSSYMKKFRTTCDEDGLIRVDWRMSNAQTDNSTSPILILSDHPLCHMLIRYHHCQLFHAGPSHMITILRKRFFIPKLKRLVKSCVSRCAVCRRYQARTYAYPDPPDLPSQRVTRSRPFQNIGLDYFGPILVRLQSSERQKVWVCLFTCMTTRAIHLEVVRDNSTLQFILAFRRFMARRGRPDTVRCDNAPTFKLGQQLIKNELPAIVDDSQMDQFLASNNINWNFITPYSPWKGGFYERLVGAVKIALKKTIRNQILDLWLFETLIIEIEAILNTRPLFPVNSQDPDTNVAIRPIDLITPTFQVARLSRSMPQKTSSTSSDSYRALRAHYEALQEDLDHFWQLWQKEYLEALAQRQVRRADGQSSKTLPRVGEVVLVRQDAHRSTWPLALILELITSSDGNIRSAKIRTGKRTIVERSINQLLPLEIVADEESIVERGYERHLAVKDSLRGTSKD